MFKVEYESVTLHNICESVAGWRTMGKRAKQDQLSQTALAWELYWLDRLERFFNAI